MRVLSFDPGVDNLGVWCGDIERCDAEKLCCVKRLCIDANINITTLYWNRVDIINTPTKCGIGEKVELAMCVLSPLLDFLLSYNPNIIIIESQITNSFYGEGKAISVGNITTKVFSHIIQALIIERTKIPVRFVNGSATIPLCENIGNTPEYFTRWNKLEPRGIKRTKYKKKKLTIKACSVFITKDEEILFEKHKKRDDLADALFQVVTYFLRENKTKDIVEKEITIEKEEDMLATPPKTKKHSKNKSDLILELNSIKNESLTVDEIKSLTVVQLKKMIKEIKEEKSKIQFF